MPCLRLLVLVADGPGNATLSYQHGWPRQLSRDPRYECTVVNLQDRSWAARLGQATLRWQRFDAIVLLHSVFSNACALTGWTFDAVRANPAPKIFFIGNEYKLMPEKMAFCEALGVSLLVTQSHSPRVQALYRERLRCAVTGIPNTGWDPDIFRPERPRTERPIDLGYRSLASPLFLGHNERVEMMEAFQASAGPHGLTVDFSLRPEDRFNERGWAAFLNSCKGQIGTEAGGDYFELTDETRRRVNDYLQAHPEAGIEDIRARFFRDYANPVPIRLLSSRNVEAAATRTVQLLLEGEYGGYFEPDVHYIRVRRDFSNVEEAIRMFQDPVLCGDISDRAQQVVIEQLTFSRLLDRFDEALRAIL